MFVVINIKQLKSKYLYRQVPRFTSFVFPVYLSLVNSPSPIYYLYTIKTIYNIKKLGFIVEANKMLFYVLFWWPYRPLLTPFNVSILICSAVPIRQVMSINYCVDYNYFNHNFCSVKSCIRVVILTGTEREYPISRWPCGDP